MDSDDSDPDYDLDHLVECGKCVSHLLGDFRELKAELALVRAELAAVNQTPP